MAALGSSSNPIRVAVFGAGPAGFYATEHLLKQTDPVVSVDLFDRLPTPFGLVRGGVAPDHQKIKSVIRAYEKTASRDRFRFFGNVAFGTDLTLDEVLSHYHQVLLCTGSESDRKLGIPGEDLEGSWPATVFVGWYNGHPDYRHYEFDLSGKSAVVVGIGNVAMDVARILARPIDELEKTDIAEHALEALRHSKIETIWLLGRRGPAQAKFTNPEIRELTEIPGVDLVVEPKDMELDEVNREFLESQDSPVAQRNMDILTVAMENGEGTNAKKIRARFFVSPVELLGDKHVEKAKLERNELVKDDKGRLRSHGTGELEEIDADVVFRSVGYLGTPLTGLPFDDWSGTIPNVDGRVMEKETEKVMPRVYVAGWIKRGPSGVIGTNKPDAIDTVKHMLEDAGEALGDGVAPDGAAIEGYLEKKGVRYVTFAEWKKLDEMEVERGKAVGKPREKFTSIEEMLAALG